MIWFDDDLRGFRHSEHPGWGTSRRPSGWSGADTTAHSESDREKWLHSTVNNLWHIASGLQPAAKKWKTRQDHQSCRYIGKLVLFVIMCSCLIDCCCNAVKFRKKVAAIWFLVIELTLESYPKSYVCSCNTHNKSCVQKSNRGLSRIWCGCCNTNESYLMLTSVSVPLLSVDILTVEVDPYFLYRI